MSALKPDSIRRKSDRIRHTKGWQPYVDAGLPEERLHALLAVQPNLCTLAEVIGVPRTTLQALTLGRRNGVPARRLRPATAAAILAVTPAMLAPVSTGRDIDEALHLVASGIDVDTAAGRYGLKPASLITTLHRRAVADGPGSRWAGLHREVTTARIEAAAVASRDAARERARAS